MTARPDPTVSSLAAPKQSVPDFLSPRGRKWQREEVQVNLHRAEVLRLVDADPAEEALADLRLHGPGKETDRDARLEQLVDELKARWRAEKLNAFEVGRLYCEAKNLLSHGEFDRWCDDLGLYSKETRCAYMRIYRFCLGRPELVDRLSVSKLQFICSKKCPDELREAIFAVGDVDCTLDELEDLANRVRKEGLDVDDPVVKGKLGACIAELTFRKFYRACEQQMQGLLRAVRATCQDLQLLRKRIRDVPDDARELEEWRWWVGLCEGIVAEMEGELE